MSSVIATRSTKSDFSKYNPFKFIRALLLGWQESKRWKHRNDLLTSLPFLEGIGVDFRVQDNHGNDNRVFVKNADGVQARLERLGFTVRTKPISKWSTMYWPKYSLAVELISEQEWEAFCKAHHIHEVEMPTLERIFEVIVGERP